MNIETLKVLYSQGVLSDEALKNLERDGIIKSHELSEITMTDKKIIALFDPDTKRVPGVPKWCFASDKRYHIILDKSYAKTHKKDLDEIMIEWYRKNFGEKKTIEYYFEKFCETKKLTGEANSENTIMYYHNNFNRFFKNIADREINSFTENELKVLLNHIAKTETKNGSGLTQKKFNEVFCLLKGIFEVAWYDHAIDEIPRINPKVFNKSCRRTQRKKDNERVVTPEELNRFINKINKAIQDNPLNMTAYASMLVILTGMRRAEVCGLKWSDIGNVDGVDVIEVKREYIYLRASKGYELVEHTKTYKDRVVPITSLIQDLFNTLKKVKEDNGYYSDFIFETDKLLNPTQLTNFGRDRRFDRKSNEGKNINVNPHKLRRTFNSNLKNKVGVDAKTAASILGHSERVNCDDYTYDTSNALYKKDVMTQVQNMFLA